MLTDDYLVTKIESENDFLNKFPRIEGTLVTAYEYLRRLREAEYPEPYNLIGCGITGVYLTMRDALKLLRGVFCFMECDSKKRGIDTPDSLVTKIENTNDFFNEFTETESRLVTAHEYLQYLVEDEFSTYLNLFASSMTGVYLIIWDAVMLLRGVFNFYDSDLFKCAPKKGGAAHV